MSENDCNLLGFDEAFEEKIKAIFENEGFTNVRVSDDTDKMPKDECTVIHFKSDGAKNQLYLKPNGKKDYSHYKATIIITHHVRRTPLNRGKLRTRMKKTRYAFLFSRIVEGEIFTPAQLSPYKIEAVGAPGPEVKQDSDIEDPKDHAEQSFSIAFSINQDAWD